MNALIPTYIYKYMHTYIKTNIHFICFCSYHRLNKEIKIKNNKNGVKHQKANICTYVRMYIYTNPYLQQYLLKIFL